MYETDRITTLEHLKQRYEENMSDRDITVIKQWLYKDINGLADDGIAKINGISRRTLVNIRQKHSEYIKVIEELKELQKEQDNTGVNSITNLDINAEVHNVLTLVLTRAKAGSVKDIEILLKNYGTFKDITEDLQRGSTDINSILESIDKL